MVREGAPSTTMAHVSKRAVDGRLSPAMTQHAWTPRDVAQLISSGP
jgi:hypothetical protein